MKLEFLYKINEFDEHAVRLSDFNSSQAKAFKAALNDSIINKRVDLEVHTLDFIVPINCSLTLRLSNEDLGIEEVVGTHLYCDLTMESYKKMEKLLEPFCTKESKGYQWLYDVDTPIDLLFSAGDM